MGASHSRAPSAFIPAQRWSLQLPVPPPPPPVAFSPSPRLPCCKDFNPEKGRTGRCKWLTQQGNGTKCQNPTFATFCPIACKKCADCDADEVAIEQQHGKLRKKVRIVGIVGDAGGKELEVIPCSNTCDEAIKRCSDHPECNIVEMAHSRVNHLRDGVHGVVISDNFTTKPLAVLRARWARWGPRLCHSGQQIEDLPRVRRVIKVIEYCASLAAQAEHQRVHSMLPLMDRKKWERYGCSEFAAPVGHQLPKVGVAHCSQDSSSAADRGHCPPRGRRAPSLLILGYQNGPSPWLCSFLQTLGHHGVSATILGWEPLGGVKRHRRDYYFADKIYSMLRFLLTCQLPESTIVLFCDTDELMQVPRFELEKSLRAALQVQETEASRGARSHHRTWTRSLPSHHHVIFAAEDYCFPAKMYQNVSGSARIKGWVAGNSAGASPTDSATAIYDSPICLNSGNYFGRPRAMIDLLNRTCMPCRRGLKVEHFQRHFHGSYTSLVPKGWFFDDQVEMAKIYVSGREEPQSTAPLLVGLDSQQRLFLPLSEWNAESILTPPKKVQIQRNGLFHSLASGTAPAFVHFNGPAKAWVGVHSASALLATLTQRYVSQTGDSQLNQLHQHVRDHVTFLDPDFHRVQGVSLSDVCSAGTSLESASATSSLKKMRQALQGSVHTGALVDAPSVAHDDSAPDSELSARP